VGTVVMVMVVSKLKTVVLVVDKRTILVPLVREHRVKVTAAVVKVPRQRMNPAVVVVALEKLVMMHG
tara:strand:- start:344 stop:544 length:201 start_codon:yes stop_codon:yes gene_type:complete